MRTTRLQKHHQFNLKSTLAVLGVGFSLVLASSSPAGVAQTAWIAARSGEAAPQLNGWTFSGLVADNGGILMPCPVLVGDAVAAMASLRQGISAPPTDRGIWMIDPSGTYRCIARQGDPAGNTEPGTSYSTIWSFGSDGQGRILFDAWVTGPFVQTPGNHAGLWVADDTQVQILARSGEPAPGTSPQVYFAQFNPQSMGQMPSGVNWFNCSVSASPDPSTGGQVRSRWAYAEQTVGLAFWAHGAPPDVSEAVLVESDCRLGACGRGVAFGRVQGPGVTSITINGNVISNAACLWRADPDGQFLLARTTEPAPGMPTGAVFSNLPTVSTPPAVNTEGNAAFTATVAGPGISFNNSTGLWTVQGTDLELLVRAGTPATAAGTGIVFGPLTANSQTRTLHLLDNGDAVFVNYVGGPGVTTSNCAVIWKRSQAGQDTLIARSGVSVAALPAGTTLVWSSLAQNIRTAGNDVVMFTAKLAGTNVTTSNDDVLLRHTSSGGLQLVAREGTTYDGHVLKSFVNNGADMQLTGTGFAVVPAMFTPASNPNGTPVLGALGVSPSGAARVLAVVNDWISLSDGTAPTIGQLRISPQSAISDDGRVVMAASFGSGTPKDEGVFVVWIDPNYVPPPPTCPADYDNSGTVAVADIISFLTDWFSGEGDYDNDGVNDQADIYAFLVDWFAGCPD